MAAEKKRQKKFLDKMVNRYRLVVLNDDTFEEKASFRLSRMNLYLLFSTVLVVIVSLTLAVIVFTPLKEYIPGYADVNLRKEMVDLKLRVDSIENVVRQDELWFQNFKNVISGKVDIGNIEVVKPGVKYDSITLDKIPPEDTKLREQIESESHYSLIFSDDNENGSSGLSRVHFFRPVDGVVTSEFNQELGHYGIDIAAAENTPVKTSLDGTVIMSSWTLQTGYVLAIQHTNSLISFYKHNSVLFKKVGNFVSSGEVVAAVGSSGEQTTGPHLHFELWHNGIPINPRDHIVF